MIRDARLEGGDIAEWEVDGGTIILTGDEAERAEREIYALPWDPQRIAMTTADADLSSGWRGDLPRNAHTTATRPVSWSAMA